MPDYRKKFIALDLETTHLDMREGKIMEVGAVEAELYFDGEEKKVKVSFGKNFSSLVNPEVEPSSAALMLTGIKKEELQTAPKWAEVKAGLRKFLGEATLLGHNLWFDLEYLKHQGLKLKNPFLDTLEIAQTILPLSAAHSLEYLVTEFELSKEPSHRALADAQNCALVLAESLNEFLRFLKELQTEVRDFLGKSKLSFRGLILDLPTPSSAPTSVGAPFPARGQGELPSSLRGRGIEGEGGYKFDWPDKTLVSLPLGFNEEQKLFVSLSRQTKSGLIAVSRQTNLDFLPGEQIIPDPALALCDKRLEWISTAWPKIPDIGYKILIKLAIFRSVIKSFDLSLAKWSQAERDYLPRFLVDPEVCFEHKCGYLKLLRFKKNQVYFLKLRTLFDLAAKWKQKFSNRSLVLLDLAAVEDEFGESISQSFNLRKIRENLSLLYPLQHEAFSWYQKFSREAEETVNELDLFFGILHLIYRRQEGDFAETVILDEQELESERFHKLAHPAEKLVAKLENFCGYLENHSRLQDEFLQIEITGLKNKLATLLRFLKEFFLDRKAEKVYWFRFDARGVDLESTPTDLKRYWTAFVHEFADVAIVDMELPQISFQYFQKRLGLENFTIEKVPAVSNMEEVKINIFSKSPDLDRAIELLHSLSGSVVAVLPNENKLSELYEHLQKEGVENKEVVAYKFSGSLPMIRSRLAKSQGGYILLLTLNAVLRYFREFSYAENLVIFRLPFEAPGKGSDLLRKQAQNNFLEHVLPRAVHLLHAMLSRFLRPDPKKGSASSSPRQIFILDSRILTDYDQAFLGYLREFPNFRLSTIDPD